MTTNAGQFARTKWPGRIAIYGSALILAFYCVTSVQIIRDSHKQELQRSDAIVVFGAAEYAGKPSPVLRARLDHALQLIQRGVAPVIITTGGSGADPDYSEGGVGKDYLLKHGVPEKSLIAETQGSDTAHSAERVAVILRTNHMNSCVAVSDQYHVFRIRKILEREGILTHVAPRPDSRPRGVWQRTLAVLRESTSYLLWKLHLT